ncbi:serine/threonine-protein kinase [Nostoc sp. UHCC 0870]|uniref:serine/threonine-protein kinase n=1 Tax=Nostoc sp. UHCC 0870 TaxID=2914041 RepID=UPI001EDDDBBD|nr:serine/threonine-protein kinase [Nostoc sp. UHCC 0870]UKO99496.1 serine/threonine protein kinase [Nostoc sp. UHCC 0870]
MSLCINPVCPKPNHLNNQKNRFCQSCGSPLELVGRYRVMHLLSDTTGFGQVYEAYEQDTAKILKVLEANLADVKAVELFHQEAVVLGKLNHPGLPRIDAYFQHHTRNNLSLYCLVLEKINGINLEQWLEKHHQLTSESQAINWLKQILEILDLVHNQSYLHLNIKPSNILIRPDGQLVLIDFGTARELAKNYQNRSATPTMSSGYSAPEQMQGKVTLQSDFFALGRTFVFLMTGKHPLDMYDAHHNLLHWRSHANQFSPLLLNLIDWLMTPAINYRPANAKEILQRIKEIETPKNAIKNNNIIITKNIQTLELTQPKIAPPPSLSAKKIKKMPLISLLVALLFSFGLLSAIAIMIGYPQFATLLPIATQAPARKGKIDYFAYEEGRDSQGGVAQFNIAILSVEYKWLPDSNFQVTNNNQIISLDVLKLMLEQEGIQKIMEDPNEIISVGIASCDTKLATAQLRAFERSQQIQLLAKKLFKNTASVKGYRLLNLGQFQRIDCKPNQDYTRYQSSVIVIGVKNKSKNVVIDEALRDRLKNKPFADFKLEDYSLGSVEKFKTISNNL